jgi:hypothetical protein
MASYHIGIKRRFWFGFKKYRVTGHKTEILGAGSRLTLNLDNGNTLAIPAIHQKMVCVYPIAMPAQLQVPVESE